MAQVENNQPEEMSYEPIVPPQKSGGGGMIKNILISVVCAVFIFFVMGFLGLGGFVKQSDFNTNLGNVAKDIAMLQTSAGTVNTLTNNYTNLMNTTIPTLATKNDLKDYAKLSDVQRQQSTVDLSAYVKSVDLNTNLGNSKTITELQSQIKTINDANTKLTATVADLQKKLEAQPVTPVPTTAPSTNGSSSTYGNVTATVTSNVTSWSGTPLVTAYMNNATGGTINAINITNGGAGYASTPTVSFSGGGGNGATATAIINAGVLTNIIVNTAGSGYTSTPTVLISGGTPTTPATATATVAPIEGSNTTSSFQVQLNNKGTKNLTSVQLAMGLTFTDANGNPLSAVPSWIIPNGTNSNISFSSSYFGSAWTYQSTVSPATLVFTNSTASSIFNSGLSLTASQIQNVTQYVTITNNNPQSSPTVYIYPQVKVLSYVEP